MPVNVLVVDDSAVMRAMIARILKLAGLPLGDIYEASNGEEGLRILSEKPADLALVNINMPIMDGEEMINRVRLNAAIAQLPIIAVSAEGNTERIERLKRHNVEMVRKPFLPEALGKKAMQIAGVSYAELGSESPLSESGPDF